MTSSISEAVFSSIHSLSREPKPAINADTPLLQDGGVMDSMTLVELCLQLEDLSATHGFDFDWTSDSAMSRSRSMFQTAGSLLKEFERQMRLGK